MEEEFGYVFKTDKEIADIMGLTERTIKKYNKSLIEKGYLDIIEIDGKKVKRFNLNKLK